jgi:hypothetical protein
VYLRGVKRAAGVKLVLPVPLALVPFHVFALGRQAAMVHFAFGLLSALVLREAVLLEYRRLPFAVSYVPEAKLTTHGGIYAFICLLSVYTIARLEHVALSTTSGTVTLFVLTVTSLATIRVIDVWQRRNPREVGLDEFIDPPTLRLGLMD